MNNSSSKTLIVLIGGVVVVTLLAFLALSGVAATFARMAGGGYGRVLPWNMVDNSSSPLQTHFGPIFRDEAVQRGLLFLEPGSIRVFLRAPSPISP